MTMATTAVGIDAPRHDAARDNARFLDELRTIVWRRYVLTSPERTRRYRTGFRFGTGRRWPSFGQATSSSNGEC
jgi:hypothetical protein